MAKAKTKKKATKKADEADEFSVSGGWDVDEAADGPAEDDGEDVAGRIDEVRSDVEKTKNGWACRDKEAARFVDIGDSEFWLCVVFRDRQSKDEFIRLMEMEPLGDKYVDGHAFAEQLGLQVEKRAGFKISAGKARWKKLAAAGGY